MSAVSDPRDMPLSAFCEKRSKYLRHALKKEFRLRRGGVPFENATVRDLLRYRDASVSYGFAGFWGAGGKVVLELLDALRELGISIQLNDTERKAVVKYQQFCERLGRKNFA